MSKPIHAKPSLYAFYFDIIKNIGLNYGYNIVLHGSLNRDLDIIAIPWIDDIGDLDSMIDEITNTIGGSIMYFNRSIIVLPVTIILLLGMFSFNKFSFALSVGAKLNVVVIEVTLLLYSSGKGL